jgi:Domain of unknown function (DUF4286)
MVIYEVNLNIHNEIYHDYYQWLLEHINDMLKFEGFNSAEVGLVEHEEEDGKIRIRVSYFINTYGNLRHYLTNHAPKMRAEGVEKFGDKFTASRRIIVEPVNFSRQSI